MEETHNRLRLKRVRVRLDLAENGKLANHRAVPQGPSGVFTTRHFRVEVIFGDYQYDV